MASQSANHPGQAVGAIALNRGDAPMSDPFLQGFLMTDAMRSMMGWMMGFGLLGWALVIALFVAIVVLLARLLSDRQSRDRRKNSDPDRPARRAR